MDSLVPMTGVVTSEMLRSSLSRGQEAAAEIRIPVAWCREGGADYEYINNPEKDSECKVPLNGKRSHDIEDGDEDDDDLDNDVMNRREDSGASPQKNSDVNEDELKLLPGNDTILLYALF